MDGTVHEAARVTPVIGEYDVVVVGGGPAGIVAAAAAAAAADGGARCLLIERYGFRGGTGTAAGVTNFCGLHANVHGEHRRVAHGLADELLDRIDALDGLNAPHLVLGRILAQADDMSAYTCAADALVASRGVRLLFHALAVAVAHREDDAIDSIIVETKSGRAAVRARVFVDCNGDGDVAHRAGVPMAKGDDDGGLLYPTLMFRVGNVDAARAGDVWRTIPALMDEAAIAGTRVFPRNGAIVRPQKRASGWRVNVTQSKTADGSAVDGTDAWSFAAGEVDGRRQVVDSLRFLRERVPGFEDAYALDIATQIGIRETRRLFGAYVLTGDDVLGCADLDDAIGVNGCRSNSRSTATSAGTSHPPGRAVSTSSRTGCASRAARKTVPCRTCSWRGAARR